MRSFSFTEEKVDSNSMSMSSTKKIFLIGAIVIAILAISISLIASSLKKLNSDQIGLKYDIYAKTLDSKVYGEGLYAGPPGFEFIIFPNVFQTLRFKDISCLNRDGVIIDLDVSYQYKANPIYLQQLVIQFQDFDSYKSVLNASGISAVHDTCAEFSTTEFQTDRGRFQESLRENMRKYCEELYCELNDLQVNNVQRPAQYESAVKDKEAAKENIRIAENERPRLILQAESEYGQAKTQSEILINNGTTEARIIKTRAETDAQLITKQYVTDLNVYKQIQSSQKLDSEALISFLSVKAISGSDNEIYFAMKSPAHTSYPSISD